ncbi:MAG: NADH-quinone oxidoreductase subunit I [Candidatus Eisenbacteria bacterium]|nr:NADH-quinone oxidoreductase subunit I [Candidatus Eisenbacteria bacterium]
MKVPSPKLSWYERIYLVEVIRGLGVTIRHMVENIFHQSAMPTVQYPEEPKPLPVRIKGRHRLTVREDGSPKCVACFMCQTACPARCIHIVAEESPTAAFEKRPEVFDIDMLRCVFCGYCVEACPEDAIRMDTGEVTIVADTREAFLFHKEFLLYGDKSAIGGGTAEPEAPLTEPPSSPEGEQEPPDGVPVTATPPRPPVPASW